MFEPREVGILKKLLGQKPETEPLIEKLREQAFTKEELETIRKTASQKLKGVTWVLEQGKSTNPETLKEYQQGLQSIIDKFGERK